MDVKDENKVVESTTTEVAEATGEKEVKEPSVDELRAELEKLRGINKEVIQSRDAAKQKLRDLDSEKERKVLEEKGAYEEALLKEREKYDVLQSQLRDTAVNAELRNALAESGTASVDTALELIDRSTIAYEDGQVNKETVADAIKTLQERHKVLFGEVRPAPTPKKAGEETPTGGYAAELKKLQGNPRATRRDLEALRQKYGK